MIGINLSGAEFGSGSHVYGIDYAYPTAEALGYYAARGVELVRLPFKWERMQPSLGGPLNPDELARMKTFLANAEAAGIQVVIDLHNYGRFGGKVIGSADLPYAQFADFWQKLAAELKGAPALAGYDIMNEPHDMGGSHVWPTAAQAAVDAIRSVDMTTAIYVEGDGWSGAWNWARHNADLWINDPAGNLIYQAHQYFDRWGTGVYNETYAADGAYPDIGVDRLQPFVNWLAERGARGFIGEFGVPSSDPQWLEVLDRFLSAMEASGISGTAWGGGFWWNPAYPLRLGTPDDGDTAAFGIIRNYLSQDDGISAAGTAAADTLLGTELADVLSGDIGDDILAGGAGADHLDGGIGTDTVSYLVSITSVDVDLLRATQRRGDAQGDSLVGIENILGGALSDTLRGDALVNRLSGGDGDDLLEGRGGGDVLDGGSGLDAAAYTSAAAGVVADLQKPQDNGGDAAGDSYLEVEDLIGSAYSDQLRGNGGVNRLYGLAGNDELWGRAGADLLDGGEGRDAASYLGSTGGVDVDLTRATQLKGEAAGDQLVDIEDIVGSAYVDNLAGDAGVNRLHGGNGNDTLNGRGGGDYIDGGLGIDLVSYADSKAGVHIDLNRELQTGGDAEGDRLVSIERVTGSAHKDVLVGTGGAETLSGGAGNDLLEGGAGADRLDGGAGIDTATYAASGASVDIDLQRTKQIGGHAAGDQLVGIEHLIGSANDDRLSGSSAVNALDGGGGPDVLNGRGGKDLLTGGAGPDIFIFDSAANANGDRVTDFEAGDILDFSRIDANSALLGDQAFLLIGSKAFTGVAGQLRIFTSSANNDTYLQGDVNGDKIGDFLIALTGVHQLSALDLLL